jgi:hypothetical protein
MSTLSIKEEVVKHSKSAIKAAIQAEVCVTLVWAMVVRPRVAWLSARLRVWF